MLKTNENGNSYEHSLDHAVEFFSKAGSLFEKNISYYNNSETALSLFQKVWITDKETAFKLLLWLRDCRGGAGNRSGFRSILNWLSEYGPLWISENIEWIPIVGRWDDLRSLFDTPLEKLVSDHWASEIKKNNVLAAKWANRKDKPLKHALYIKKEGDFRKLLASIRKNYIVEHKMCNKIYNEIDYCTVPSLAMARYTNAFNKNDPGRFNKYKNNLINGETEIKAKVLFPHDCVKTVKYGDKEIADAQFDSLPNYLENTNERIIVISDTSGSMHFSISGKIEAVDVSQSLALYCSAKIPSTNPFYKKFIGFCSEGKFKNWEHLKFSEAVLDRKIFDGAIGSTRIDRALDLILETAKFYNLTNNEIPTTILIVSDMQFHRGVRSRNKDLNKLTEVNIALDRWKDVGYNIPKIVYWNLAGYLGSPELESKSNVALVSGFSPSILKDLFSGNDMTPVKIMKRTLEKYKINIPKET